MTPLGPTVFSMNLRFGRADDGPNGWSFRKRLIPPLLKTYPADFYAFQEVNDFQAEDLQAILPDYGVIGRRHPAPSYWQNNLIFYHPDWRLNDCHHFYLSATPNIPSKFDDSKWPRQCTMGVFSQSNRSIVCINTHFDFKPKVREKSAQLILSRLSGLTINAAAILMGDFNATPDERCYQLFAGYQKKVATEAETPAFKGVFKPPYPSTYHGFTGIAQSGMIDWVLYRGALEPLVATVIEDSINGGYPSDHFPLMVQFGWR